MDKWRDRKFRLLLYPDDPSHVDAVSKINSLSLEHIGILHEHDVWSGDDEDLGSHTIGDPKKPHWHFVVKFPNPRWSSAVCSLLCIKENYVKPCDNFDGAVRYLIHYGFPDKYQYEVTDCFGSLVPYLVKVSMEQTEEARILTIISLLDEYEGVLSYRKFLILACENALYSDFRRLGQGVKYLLDEHNAQWCYDLSLQKQKSEYEDALNQAHFAGYVSGHSDQRIQLLKKGG